MRGGKGGEGEGAGVAEGGSAGRWCWWRPPYGPQIKFGATDPGGGLGGGSVRLERWRRDTPVQAGGRLRGKRGYDGGGGGNDGRWGWERRDGGL